jgi:hypothetical protein
MGSYNKPTSYLKDAEKLPRQTHTRHQHPSSYTKQQLAYTHIPPSSAPAPPPRPTQPQPQCHVPTGRATSPAPKLSHPLPRDQPHHPTLPMGSKYVGPQLYARSPAGTSCDRTGSRTRCTVGALCSENWATSRHRIPERCVASLQGNAAGK